MGDGLVLDNDVEDKFKNLENIVRRNVVPAYPPFITLLLQAVEAGKVSNSELSSYGHCYQTLVLTNLLRVGVHPQELDMYFNVLTELSYELHVLGDTDQPRVHLNQFFERYEREYVFTDQQLVEATLQKAGLLMIYEKSYGVVRYVRAYFAGKYLAESVATKPETVARLNFLAETAHNDDHALTLLFTSHHTKQKSVIDTLLLNLMLSLDGIPNTELRAERFDQVKAGFLELPLSVLEEKSTAEFRNSEMDNQEKRNTRMEDLDKASKTLDAEDEVARIIRAVKAIEIAGQLVRNRYGSLPKDTISDFAREAVECSKRFCEYIVAACETLVTSMPELVAELREDQSELSDQEMEKDIKSYLSFVLIFGMHGAIRQVCHHFSHPPLIPLIIEELRKQPSPINQILEVHFLLQTNNDNAVKAIAEIAKPFRDSHPFAFRLLQQAVHDRIVLRQISFDDKQRIANMFGIQVPSQVIANARRIQ